MTQVSRPIQIMLALALVFVALWFTVLRPKEPVAEPVAATPAVPAETTPAADAGGAAAQTDLGKVVETAKNGAAAADAATAKSQAQTGETDPSATTSGAADAAAPTTGKPATAPAPTTPAAAKAAKGKPATSKAQASADAAIRKIKRDLKARRAVVVLVWSPSNKEDRVLKTRVTKQISRRGGRVTVHLINVRDVGRYDGLLSGLAIAQTPSTIVIAPSNEAKVLGGLVSTERIDRLTSSAVQTEPATTR